MNRSTRLAIEILALYVVPPVLVWADVVDLYTLAAVVGASVGALIFRERRTGLPHDARIEEATMRRQLHRVLRRFLVCVSLVVVGLWLYDPGALLAFPRRNPRVWLTVMILYPLVSAALQELMYRHLFFRRYLVLAPGNVQFLVVLNVLLFAWLHIFLSPLAVVLCIPAGWFFADTYLRSRSFRLAWLEHALYGDFIFTVGLGMYFYHGAG